MSARAIRELLLTRSGRVFVDSAGDARDVVLGLEVELAALGYVLSHRLRARLEAASRDEVASLHGFLLATLSKHLGADQKHEPLFRKFPDGIPPDTLDLYWTKVLLHYLQDEAQPCLFCGRIGTTHVLNPCSHVVCDHCFDGANYSACPVCEHHVDRGSPFFQPSPQRKPGNERVTFKLLDLGTDESSEARALFESLCARKQALSPDDRAALAIVARLDWVPRVIPVRENVAIVFGTLFNKHDPNDVLPVARRFMTTATDVLRFLAVISGADASLQGETVYRAARVGSDERRWSGKVAALLATAHAQRAGAAMVAIKVKRFKIAKLRRSLRRALLAVLEGCDRLTEDMLRHRSYWVWAGEFLHPGEYADRFPRVAEAFDVIRNDRPFETYYAKLEAAAASRDTQRLTALLEERPGELARRFDYALRVGGDEVLLAFERHTRAFATPVLLTLWSHLRLRDKSVGTRVYWPKGAVAKGVFAKDTRPPLPTEYIAAARGDIEAELLRRFAGKPHFDDALIDASLDRVMVPFNERTASPSAVNLPRGSRVAVPRGKIARLFLHWCEPEKNGRATDIDLSVGFYDDNWNHVGVCSYYELSLRANGVEIATSAGDMRDAPFPEGATEFVDLHRDAARAAGFRYAVMVVNNYSGMAFSRLERGFAGVMLRDDALGLHFDPRTVALRFAVTGDNGVYMPLVFDLATDTVHWLDVQSTGGLAFNNVATSNSAITTICPTLMEYFASGTRTSMLELALLHAAARCRRVIVRGRGVYVRRDGEDERAFFHRMQVEGGEPRSPALETPALVALYSGDVAVPAGSQTYALFREQLTGTIAASDLLS